MKYAVCAAILGFLSLAAPAWGQGIAGGGKVGVNFARISQSSLGFDALDMKVGVVAGGFLDVGVTEMFSIQPEALFTMKGARTNDSPRVWLNIDEIEIPVLAKLRFPPGTVRPFMVAGPGFGFVTRARATQGDLEDDFKDDLETFDLSVVVGAGVEFARWMVEGRYDVSVRDVDKDEFNDARNHVVSVLVGFRFGH